MKIISSQKYSNGDLDDAANGLCNYELAIEIPSGYDLNSDLNEISKVKSVDVTNLTLNGKQRTDFSLYIEPKSKFYSYKNDQVEVVTNLKDNNLNDIQKGFID